MQSDRWTLWAPVAFGIGAALYLSLPAEPLVAVAFLALAAAGGLVLAVSRWSLGKPLTIALTLAAFMLAGFAAGRWNHRVLGAAFRLGGV